MRNMFKVVFFDFGGVLAEEGFCQGLLEIGKKNNGDPDALFRIVDALRNKWGQT